MRKDNKIRSPPHSSNMSAKGDGNSDITNLFLIKNLSKPLQSSVHGISNGVVDNNFPQKSDTLSETQEMSQMSDEIFQLNRKSSVDSPSRTDSKSYRDIVKNRFQMIKENAGKSTHKSSFKDTTKKLIMERMRQENETIGFEIEEKRNRIKGRNDNQQKLYHFFVGENRQPEESILHSLLRNETRATTYNFIYFIYSRAHKILLTLYRFLVMRAPEIQSTNLKTVNSI